MTIDYQRLFHTGIRVGDLDQAMAELGGSLGLVWAEVQQVPEMQYWTPVNGTTAAPLRFVYSCHEPQHVELVEGGPGSIWDGREAPGVHHVGVWCDDVAAETEAAVADGWACLAAGAAPEDGYGRWSYVQPPTGMLVELVSGEIRAGFEMWWSAGLTTAMPPVTEEDRGRSADRLRHAIGELRDAHQPIARARMGIDAEATMDSHQASAAFGVSVQEVDTIVEEVLWRVSRNTKS